MSSIDDAQPQAPVEVVAGILEEEGRFLVARRSEAGRLPGLWEFPGGKVEPGESRTDALERELMEELGLRVRVGEVVASSLHSYPEGEIRLSGYRIYREMGEPELRVHQELRWVTRGELRDLSLAPADLPLVEALEDPIS
jgi:mutator protein MutT